MVDDILIMFPLLRVLSPEGLHFLTNVPLYICLGLLCFAQPLLKVCDIVRELLQLLHLRHQLGGAVGGLVVDHVVAGLEVTGQAAQVVLSWLVNALGELFDEGLHILSCL